MFLPLVQQLMLRKAGAWGIRYTFVGVSYQVQDVGVRIVEEGRLPVGVRGMFSFLSLWF